MACASSCAKARRVVYAVELTQGQGLLTRSRIEPRVEKESRQIESLAVDCQRATEFAIDRSIEQVLAHLVRRGKKGLRA